jgi:hypothetical protein
MKFGSEKGSNGKEKIYINKKMVRNDKMTRN